GHHDKLGGDVDVKLFERIEVGEVLLGHPGDGDIPDVDLLFLHQLVKELEGSFVHFELDAVARLHAGGSSLHVSSRRLGKGVGGGGHPAEAGGASGSIAALPPRRPTSWPSPPRARRGRIVCKRPAATERPRTIAQSRARDPLSPVPQGPGPAWVKASGRGRSRLVARASRRPRSCRCRAKGQPGPRREVPWGW